MSASTSPTPYLLKCPFCGSLHSFKTGLHQHSKSLTIGKLPESDHPWIAIRYMGVVIWANQEWSPMIEHPDGQIEAIAAHLPHADRYGNADDA